MVHHVVWSWRTSTEASCRGIPTCLLKRARSVTCVYKILKGPVPLLKNAAHILVPALLGAQMPCQTCVRRVLSAGVSRMPPGALLSKRREIRRAPLQCLLNSWAAPHGRKVSTAAKQLPLELKLFAKSGFSDESLAWGMLLLRSTIPTSTIPTSTRPSRGV